MPSAGSWRSSRAEPAFHAGGALRDGALPADWRRSLSGSGRRTASVIRKRDAICRSRAADDIRGNRVADRDDEVGLATIVEHDSDPRLELRSCAPRVLGIPHREQSLGTDELGHGLDLADRRLQCLGDSSSRQAPSRCRYGLARDRSAATRPAACRRAVCASPTVPSGRSSQRRDAHSNSCREPYRGSRSHGPPASRRAPKPAGRSWSRWRIGPCGQRSTSSTVLVVWNTKATLQRRGSVAPDLALGVHVFCEQLCGRRDRVIAAGKQVCQHGRPSFWCLPCAS